MKYSNILAPTSDPRNLPRPWIGTRNEEAGQGQIHQSLPGQRGEHRSIQKTKRRRGIDRQIRHFFSYAVQR